MGPLNSSIRSSVVVIWIRAPTRAKIINMIRRVLGMGSHLSVPIISIVRMGVPHTRIK
jgi:hypothetical protein